MARIYNSQLDAFDLYHKINESSDSVPSLVQGPVLPALGHAIAGSCGSVISNVITYPLALIVTRLQVQRQLRHSARAGQANPYQTLYSAAEKVYNDDGLNGLFVGVESDTAKTVADSFLFFLSYNFLRQSRLRMKARSNHLPVVDELSVGFLAGSFSKFLTTPIANIVTRKQTASMSASSHNKNISVKEIARMIHAEGGLQGFWSGYSASLILTLNPSLTFFFYETLKRTLLPGAQRSHPAARATFLLAALSKAMASAITYPISLAKTRLQVSGSQAVEKASQAETASRRGSNNIFTILRHIAKVEGLDGLYEGLHGEILKGFFSHGITMLSKEMVHKVVIHLYYAILKLLKRYPGPYNMTIAAKRQVKATAETTTQTLSTVSPTSALHRAKNVR